MPTSHIPSQDFGGKGPNLLFLHANGYPPACYRPLLTRLARSNHVTAMLQRPLWEDSRPEDIHDWTPFSDDLLRFLDENESRAPTTVIGHSMGGIAALRAALRQPQKFQYLILLDPVLLPPPSLRSGISHSHSNLRIAFTRIFYLRKIAAAILTTLIFSSKDT